MVSDKVFQSGGLQFDIHVARFLSLLLGRVHFGGLFQTGSLLRLV